MSANQRYKIKLNKEKPSHKEVNQHKNFKRVLLQYRRTAKREPLHAQLLKLNKLLPTLFIMVFALIIFIYYDVAKKQNEPEKTPTEKVDSTKVNTPLPLQPVDSSAQKVSKP